MIDRVSAGKLKMQIRLAVLLARGVLVKLNQDFGAGHPIGLASEDLLVDEHPVGLLFGLLTGEHGFPGVVGSDFEMIRVGIHGLGIERSRETSAAPAD